MVVFVLKEMGGELVLACKRRVEGLNRGVKARYNARMEVSARPLSPLRLELRPFRRVFMPHHAKLYRVISPTPLTLHLLDGSTISAPKRSIVAPVHDQLFERAFKAGYLVPVRDDRPTVQAQQQIIASSAAAPTPVSEDQAETLAAQAEPESSTKLSDAADAEAVEVSHGEAHEPAVDEAQALPLEPSESAPQDALALVESLDLPERTIGQLVAGGFVYVSQLVAATDEELEAVNGVGARTVKSIRAAIAAL